MTTTQPLTLIKREYWENHQLLARLPFWLFIIISVFCVTIAAISFSSHFHLTSNHFGNINIHSHISLYQMIQTSNILLPLFSLFLWLTMFTFSLRTLYTDRKDGSVFFWQSMPTSTTQTVFSKLVTIFLIAPLFTWLCLTLSQWVFYLAMSIGHFGITANGISALNILYLLLMNVVHNGIQLLFQGIWLAPIIGLCLISSAASKKSPAVPVMVGLILIIILDLLLESSHFISRFILIRFEYALNGSLALANQVSTHLVASTEFWLQPDIIFISGIILAGFFIAIAGYIRSKNYNF